MTLTDMLMLAIAVGLASIFTYSTWSPEWLSRHWTPARLVREARGLSAVRWFFAAAAIGALVLALVQWMRAGEGASWKGLGKASGMPGNIEHGT